MDVVGLDKEDWGDDHVHTIDLWYSTRHGCWIVERLNHQGALVGTSHRCATLADAEACLSHWLRSHDETFVVAARSSLRSAESASTAVPSTEALQRNASATGHVVGSPRPQRRRAA